MFGEFSDRWNAGRLHRKFYSMGEQPPQPRTAYQWKIKGAMGLSYGVP